jgi:hypothetical protein
MAKIIVSIDATDEKRAALVKRVADALGVLAEDVVLVPAGCCVSVLEVPAELTKARDKETKHEAHPGKYSHAAKAKE